MYQSPRWGRSTADGTAEDVFRDHVSPIVQGKCINCHVADGPSGHTRLVFVPASNADHLVLNQAMFEDFLAAVADGADVILNKIRGVGHGGGVQVPAGGEEYRRMEEFLGLLGGTSSGVSITPETLFDGLELAPERTTLRRAALIFAGRAPGQADYDRLQEHGIRAAIRALMTGEAFHNFLIRSSNDRLLTDREQVVLSNVQGAPLVNYVNEWVHRCQVARANNDFTPNNDEWVRRAQYGARRAPLELIAHVVENDLPYTEILTADYIMANPWSARAYGSTTAFQDPEDVHEFQPVPNWAILSFRRVAGFPPIAGVRVVHRRSRRSRSGLPPRRHPQHHGLPAPLSDYGHEQKPRSLALDLLSLHGRGHREVGVAHKPIPWHWPTRTIRPSRIQPAQRATSHSTRWLASSRTTATLATTVQTWGVSTRWTSSIRTTQLAAMTTWSRRRRSTNGSGSSPKPSSRRGRTRSASRPSVAPLSAWIPSPSATRAARWLHITRPATSQRRESADAFDWKAEFRIFAGSSACLLAVDVEVPRGGRYEVTVEAWDFESWDEQPALLRVWAPGYFYREGDTWYRDMRVPGFGAQVAPDPDNSTQWLARAITADDRFAEAAVKFWWPAIMGDDVASPPELADDADFDAQLLRAGAQQLEVERLGEGLP